MIRIVPFTCAGSIQLAQMNCRLNAMDIRHHGRQQLSKMDYLAQLHDKSKRHFHPVCRLLK